MKERIFYSETHYESVRKRQNLEEKMTPSHKHNATFFQQNEMLCMEFPHKSTSQNESYKHMSLKTKGN